MHIPASAFIVLNLHSSWNVSAFPHTPSTLMCAHLTHTVSVIKSPFPVLHHKITSSENAQQSLSSIAQHSWFISPARGIWHGRPQQTKALSWQPCFSFSLGAKGHFLQPPLGVVSRYATFMGFSNLVKWLSGKVHVSFSLCFVLHLLVDNMQDK